MKTPINSNEKKITEQYHKLFDSKRELHKLMRRVVISTKLGRQTKQPDDDIDLEIGNGILGSCARYEQVRYYPLGLSGEYQLDDDVEIIEYLIKEIKTRFLQFQKDRNSNKIEYMKNKRRFAQEYFHKPLIKIEEAFK